MGSLRSGRPPSYWGPIKQVALKFPIMSEWFRIAKRIAHYRGISFNEFVRQVVKREVDNWRNNKMWACKCTDDKGLRRLYFKITHYCNYCGTYQLPIYEKMGRKG